MKILVLGASGKTGRLVVDRALAAHHTVVALTHSEDPKHPFPAGVDVIHGDARNPSRLRTAMEGCHAVIDAIGGKTPFKDTDLESSTAKVVLDVMQELAVKRLIVISFLGAGDSEDQAGFFYKHLMLPLFLRGALKDKNEMEREITHSHVEWVIVRPPILSDADSTGSVKVIEEGEHAHKITRGDLAQFLVDQLTSDQHLGQHVTIANT